jgi:DNA helicase-2/ATP-dependent DNA helicase PcrA
VVARRLVIGPPGTGKTRFGIKRVEEAIGAGILPGKILYASFTRAAAYEARQRAIEAFPDLDEDDFPYFRTLHSIAFRRLNLSRPAMFDGHRLKEFAKVFNYKFSDEALEKDIFQQEIADLGLGTEADTYMAFDEWRKNRLMLDVDAACAEFIRGHLQLPGDFNIKALKLFLERKEEFKQREGLWEFSDLLISAYQSPQPLDVDFVVIDEAQDQSPLLMAVAETWAQGAADFYLLGDPDQAVYSFMGAEPSLMINWKRDEDIVLRQSYRCSQAVHDLSRRVVERMKVRYHSDFDPTDSPGSVTKTSLQGATLNGGGSIFALFRTRYLMEDFFNHLLSKGMPFTTRRGRQSPLDKMGGDIVLNLVKLAGDERITMSELNRIAKSVPQVPYLHRGSKQDILQRARDDPNHWVSRVSLPALGFTGEFISRLDTEEYLECLKIEPDEKRYFRKLLKTYGRQALIDRPKLQLGTIHSVKGLEADRVLLSTEMTRLPYENLSVGDADSEHRVYYVAITRAKEQVDLLLPESWRAYPL